jgi:hypothetical protein
MPRLGGRHPIKPLSVQEQLELSATEDLKPLNYRQQKEARDEKRRTREIMIEEERFRRQHFTDRFHLCPVCLDTCNGFMARSKRAVLCLRLRSPSPDDYQLGWWHSVRGRVCNCGKRHEAEPV